MNLNKADLIGRMTRDPEKRVLPNGTDVVNFSVATNHAYKKQDGSKVETTQFHNCVAFGKIAGIIAQYAVKGQEVYVGGRIEYRSWEKDGQKRERTEIVVENFQLGQKPGPRNAQPAQEAPAETVAVDEDIKVEDIPF